MQDPEAAHPGPHGQSGGAAQRRCPPDRSPAPARSGRTGRRRAATVRARGTRRPRRGTPSVSAVNDGRHRPGPPPQLPVPHLPAEQRRPGGRRGQRAEQRDDDQSRCRTRPRSPSTRPRSAPRPARRTAGAEGGGAQRREHELLGGGQHGGRASRMGSARRRSSAMAASSSSPSVIGRSGRSGCANTAGILFDAVTARGASREPAGPPWTSAGGFADAPVTHRCIEGYGAGGAHEAPARTPRKARHDPPEFRGAPCSPPRPPPPPPRWSPPHRRRPPPRPAEDLRPHRAGHVGHPRQRLQLGLLPGRRVRRQRAQRRRRREAGHAGQPDPGRAAGQGDAGARRRRHHPGHAAGHVLRQAGADHRDR